MNTDPTLLFHGGQSVPEPGPSTVYRWGRGNLRGVWCSQSGRCCLMGVILSIGAILISSLPLISQNRQNSYTDMRAELHPDLRITHYSDHDDPGAMIRYKVEIGGTCKFHLFCNV